MRRIVLGGARGAGQVALVDDDDYAAIKDTKWYLGPQGYAQGVHHGTVVMLHRLILRAPQGMVADHINGLKLDCRRSNLRIVTQTENRRNSVPRSGNLDRIPGVRVRGAKCYEAQWTVNGATETQRFPTFREAALARRARDYEAGNLARVQHIDRVLETVA